MNHLIRKAFPALLTLVISLTAVAWNSPALAQGLNEAAAITNGEETRNIFLDDFTDQNELASDFCYARAAYSSLRDFQWALGYLQVYADRNHPGNKPKFSYHVAPVFLSARAGVFRFIDSCLNDGRFTSTIAAAAAGTVGGANIANWAAQSLGYANAASVPQGLIQGYRFVPIGNNLPGNYDASSLYQADQIFETANIYYHYNRQSFGTQNAPILRNAALFSEDLAKTLLLAYWVKIVSQNDNEQNHQELQQTANDSLAQASCANPFVLLGAGGFAAYMAGVNGEVITLGYDLYVQPLITTLHVAFGAFYGI